MTGIGKFAVDRLVTQALRMLYKHAQMHPQALVTKCTSAHVCVVLSVTAVTAVAVMDSACVAFACAALIGTCNNSQRSDMKCKICPWHVI